jgi:hypothetical protein
MPRSAMDYGIPDFSDAVLRTLSSDQKRYGEKGRYASRELAARQGVYSEADQYRAALERAAYGDAGQQYGAGLGQITNYLARSGPLADSGAGGALRAKLYGQIYGQARSRIGAGYADYLKQLLAKRRDYNYQYALQALQNKGQQRKPLDYITAAAGGILPAVL